jgi:hypothetical protein
MSQLSSGEEPNSQKVNINYFDLWSLTVLDKQPPNRIDLNVEDKTIRLADHQGIGALAWARRSQQDEDLFEPEEV